MTVRLVTWNLWWRFGPWRERMTAITASLIAERPDVVTLQEVWADADRNQAELLAAALGLEHVAWSPNREPGSWQRRVDDGGPDVAIGNAILSRWPLDTDELLLPHGDRREGRTALGAIVDHPAGPFPLVTTHLSSPPPESAVRVDQVRALMPFVAGLLARTPGAIPVVTGDLNAEPESDEVRLLSGLLTAPVVPGLSLVDAWRYAPRGEPGWTWRRENPHLADSKIDARIDYVLLGLLTRVVDVGLVGAGAIDGMWPSDHLGVRVDLAL